MTPILEMFDWISGHALLTALIVVAVICAVMLVLKPAQDGAKE